MACLFDNAGACLLAVTQQQPFLLSQSYGFQPLSSELCLHINLEDYSITVTAMETHTGMPTVA
jgi:hypothetical protein